MNKNDPTRDHYFLVKEMFEAVDYIRNFNPSAAREFSSGFPEDLPLMLTGEGSSRIFPAKNAVHNRLKYGKGPLVLTEGSTDLISKDLGDFIVIGASNSGRTKELVNLFRKLKNSGHRHIYGLTCNAGSLLEQFSEKTFIIDAGVEKAVAATKSVVAQALFYDALMTDPVILDVSGLSESFEKSLNLEISGQVADLISKAEMVFFAGNNNGVAEELTLKTNEIIRKKSAYLPGTYLLHGVEEVISPNDIIIMVDAYPDEYDKIRSIYPDNIGTPVIAFSSGPSPFHTITIPAVPEMHEPYVKLAAGWNLLVETGIRIGIDLDKPERARKIGNEAAGN